MIERIIEIKKRLDENERIIDVIRTSATNPIEGGKDIFKKQILNQQEKNIGDKTNIPFNNRLLRLFNHE